jgi:hypothetical protein
MTPENDYKLLAEVAGSGAKIGLFASTNEDRDNGTALYLAFAVDGAEGPEISLFHLSAVECNTLAVALVGARDAAEAHELAWVQAEGNA